MKVETRNATLQDLAAMLQDQQARKMDVVAPASTIRSHGGHLVLRNTEPIITAEGVTTVDGSYLPTTVCDEGIAEKLGIPVAYLRKMRDIRPDLYDANVNGWLRGTAAVDQIKQDPDSRSFLVRCFRGDEDEVGIARAFLSDRYRPIDNLDVLMAALEGIQSAGVEVKIDGCDLSNRRMYVRVVSPEVQVMAERMLRGYRNPFGDDFERWRRVADREGMGYGDGSEPVIFAGFVISNSEVGGGAFSLTPRAVVKVCANGLTINADMMREVHLGGKLESGVIDWSTETQERAIELVRSKTVDAVRTFLSPEYLSEAIGKMEEKSEEKIDSVEEVKVVTKNLRFSQEHMDGILNRFVQGGQMTRGGVANAITAHAQMVSDPDVAATLEEQAVAVLS